MILETTDDLSNLFKDYYMDYTEKARFELISKLFKEKFPTRLVRLCVMNNILYITDCHFLEKIIHKYKIKNSYSIIYFILFTKIEENILIIYEEPLRKLMDCNEKYKIQHNFVKRIINEPIQLINKRTEMYIDIENIKQNKKVIAWKFVRQKDIGEEQ